MTRPTEPRSLEEVHVELGRALRNNTATVPEIGALLNEAKPMMPHGSWLSWLARFRIEKRSAQRYMQAADWVAKYDTVTHFEWEYLSAGAIYALSSGIHSDDVIKSVLVAAGAGRHISEADVEDIAAAGASAEILRELKAEEDAEHARRLALAMAAGHETVAAWESAIDAAGIALIAAREEQAKAKEKAEADAIDAILDGPPDPTLPLVSEPAVVAPPHLATFENAIAMLRMVHTKPLDTFASTKAACDDIDQIANFLYAVGRKLAVRPEPVKAEPDILPIKAIAWRIDEPLQGELLLPLE
jgi:hypothetical protein